MLADAEVEVAAREIALLDRAVVVDQRQRRRCEIGGPADELGHLRRGPLEDLVGRLAGRDRLVVGAELRDVEVPPIGQLPAREAVEPRLEVGMLLAPRVHALLPFGLLVLAALDHRAEVLERLVRDEEGLLARPAVLLLGQLDLVLAQRRAVRARRVLLVGRAERDVGANDDQRRPVLDLLGLRDRVLERVELDVLAEVLDMPAVGLVALAGVLGQRERRVAFDRDVVLVVERDQPAEAEMAGQRAGLGGDALLDVAVGGDRVRVVVDDVAARPVEAGGPHALGERHARGVGDALAERAGRHLDAGGVAELRMARGRAAELAEVLEVVEGEPVPGQIEHRVEEHRRVTGAEHEAVPVEPVRILRVVAHHPRVEDIRQRSEGHRRARMAGIGLLDAVHRQGADGVDTQLVEGSLVRRRAHTASSRMALVVRPYRSRPVST